MNHMERTQMKKKIIITIVLVLISGNLLVAVHGCKREGTPSKATAAKDMYTCPMHPQITSDKPGKCSICNMDLVKRTAEPNAK
jgi:Cu(I)/Ag(I) efflux system membrane fusion protein